jgi:predicted AAA+ superfamily ATPase
MTLRPWREIAVPHPDVLEGTFQQSEFAADITAVRNGKASREYQQAGAFFERTYITEGMRLLLTQVAQRLNGLGGEPVVQLQTAFGGGKTHTMLAVYHLATREASLNDLPGVPALLDRAGVMDVPRARVAVLDGNEHGPGQTWKHGRIVVHTLWGELAWQLGGADGYELVRAADTYGTSPGKDLLRELLDRYSPCVVLIDELVAYVRQFSDSQVLSGGTYDSNLSFVQALTEAVKLVPNAILLASLPESDVEGGSSRGVIALRALEKTFGRVQALWKPVATEESFEIVRRRLFQPIGDLAARDEVCRAFAGMYIDEGAKLPSETREARYLDRLSKSYPIHPEVFDRLYQDWSTLEKFQRTRGVLKLMALAVHELWAKENKDLLILPASLPLGRGKTRDELVSHLPQGWDAVLDCDVDSERAESVELDKRETRFGAIHAARRVARAAFFGSAPSSSGTKNLARGVDRARIVLGCLQPGQSSSMYSDALNRLTDRLHYLNASGDKSADATRFWFDTRANLRREMEDRKGRFEKGNEQRAKLAEVLTKLIAGRWLFDGVHVFTAHADVPDDGQLRLVVLDPERHYSKQSEVDAAEAVKDHVRNNGAKPRFKGNRLVFLTPDSGSTGRLMDALRTALAWKSIGDEISKGDLNVDRLQEAQAKKELETAEAVAVRAARECYKWILNPVMHAATDREVQVEAFQINTGAPSLPSEIERVCEENELVIKAWSPIHLRNRLRELYWKEGRAAIKATAVWEDMQKYLYLSRLKNRAVFDQVVTAGAASKDFFGIAYGQSGEKFEGFSLGVQGVQVDDTLLLIEPEAARAYHEAQQRPPEPTPAPPPVTDDGTLPAASTMVPPQTGLVLTKPLHGGGGNAVAVVPPRSTSFFGTTEVNPASAKMRLVSLAEEIISVLNSDPKGAVRVTLEINADYPEGVPDHIKRAVSENAAQLGFTTNWE